jgi:ADP-ribosylglycohydrolase
MLVLIGMIVGVGIVSLDKMETAGLTTYSNQTSQEALRYAASIGNTTSSIAAIPTSWLSLIVTIVILSIIVVIMVRSFAGIGDRQ